ncbi:hypothetical protein BDP27DRAFT_1328955 [Rhodocollybia butyracea]|uniref:Uncharacterized protein n=1 Tax=Rhodocollybia butyracea TaxID=206335 RepID=A0A9P5PQA2_9AGAR|nr:hypothetical protein BDP27DRAFT_1328955 [Rhodocollybia butyracea]
MVIISSGKSTTLSVLASLSGRTSGSVRSNIEDRTGMDKPPPGTMGIVPQVQLRAFRYHAVPESPS